MSEKPTVVEALSAAMAEVQAIGKGDRNTEQGYSFRGVDAVVNAVGPVFRKHGIVPVPTKVQSSYRDVLTSREKRSRECTVTVTYRFYGPAGDFIDAEVPGESMDFGDKGAPKAMSVAYRILLLQTLCIPTHEPEPDSQTYERAAEWDTTAVRPPTEAQAAKFDELAKSIATADRTTLRGVWDSIVAAFKTDEITTAQANALRSALTAKKELEAGGDSTDDTERGGDPADGPGPGPGADGDGAGERGQGRDGEASGVRPGVQPSLPVGDGQRRAPQARGDRRGAPAEIGQ